MDRWPLVPLGELLELQREEVKVDPDATYQPAGIYSFGRGLFPRPPIKGAETRYKTLTPLSTDTLVYSKVGSWEGAFAIVSSEHEGLVVSPEYPTFRVRTERVLPDYLRALIRWPGYWEGLRPKGSMVRRKRVAPTSLLDYRVPLAPFDQQSRVANLIACQSDAIEQCEAASERGKALERGLLESLFSLLEDEAPRIPLGGVMTQVRDEVVIEPEQTYYPAGIYSFGRGLFARPPISGADTKYKKFNRLHEGQFVLSRLKGWEGAMAVVGGELEGLTVSSEFPTFTLRPDLDPSYLAAVVSRPRFWGLLADASHGIGARRERVKIDRLLATEIPIPGREEQLRIGRIGDRLAKVRRRREQATEVRKALLPSILNELFS